MSGSEDEQELVETGSGRHGQYKQRYMDTRADHPRVKTQMEKDIDEILDGEHTTTTRGRGSQFVTFLQGLATLAFFAGSIAMFVLSGYEHDKGKGELPFGFYTDNGEFKSGRHVKVGFILASFMLVVAGFYFYDILKLYKKPFRILSNIFRSKSLTIPKASDVGQRRYDSGRQKRQYNRIMLTWPPLMYVMHMAVGNADGGSLIPLALLHVASVFALGLMESEALHVRDIDNKAASEVGTREHNQKFRAAGYIGHASLWSAIFSIAGFGLLWFDFQNNRDDPGSFVRTTFEPALYILTIGYFVYWFLAVSASNYGMTHAQDLYTWWLTWIPGELLGPLAKKIMDKGIVQEFFVLVLDLLFYSVITWIIYDDVVTVRITTPLP